MVYVGSRLGAVGGQGPEPALIDPRLKVDWRNPDWQGAELDYWPSYDRIPARSRAAYLTWLADARTQRSVPIGYVFLFFYGLERRSIVDLRLDASHPEIAQISHEVRRLLDMYGDNRSFERYASDFLDLLAGADALQADLAPPDHTQLPQEWDVPLVVRIALGRYVAAGQPIPADWALTLLRTHPDAYLRTPATRCVAEFDALFKIRYRAAFGAGMTVRPPKATVHLSYRPASGGFTGEVKADLGSIPDITRITGPITKLRDLGAECTDELDAYSRFIGRNPDAVGTPPAAGLLPHDLLATQGGPAIAGLRAWATEAVSTGPVIVDLEVVVEKWSPGRTAKLAKADAVGIAALLGKFGVGVEPDVRFGASTPTPGSQVLLFVQPVTAPAAPSPAYTTAAALVHLTAVVAAADGSVTPQERAQVAAHLETILGLDDLERSRLEAHLLWLTAGKPALRGLKKRLDALSGPQRTAIGRFLVDVAAADGQVTPDEIATLTKVYKLLGLDEGEVYRTVHSLGSADLGPQTVRPAEPEKRWAIPAARPQEREAAGHIPAAVQLDPAKVRARLAETATVTALLADIFTDDDAEAAVPAALVTEASTALARPSAAESASVPGPSVPGLDPAHSALAALLRTHTTWERSDLEELAAQLGLPLLDGALDRVNEAALDACGEPLIEGDDTFEVNDYAVEELFA